MRKLQIPNIKDYGKGIPKLIWKIYYNMPNDLYPCVIEMNQFDDKDKAISVIKDFMDRGAIVFTHFNSNYSRLFILKNESTERYIHERKKSSSTGK